MALRLSKYRRDDTRPNLVHSNYERWQRNAGVKTNQKIFCMTGWYPSVRIFDNLQGLYLDCVYFSILLLIIPFHLSIFY